MDAVAENGRNPVSKDQIRPEWGRLGRVMQDGTAEPISRDQSLTREWGQEKKHFP